VNCWRLSRVGFILCLLLASAGILRCAEVENTEAFPQGKFDPTLSPGGDQVAFAWASEGGVHSHIYVDQLCSWPASSCKGRREAPLRLTTNSAPDFGPAWSPDGQEIAFWRRAAKVGQIFLVSARGGVERRLGDSMVGHPQLAWSPDGRYLAFTDRDSPNGASAIFLLSVEKASRRRLTTPPAETLGDDLPALSPDGRTLAFRRTLRAGTAGIYFQALDGAEPAGPAQRLEVRWEANHGAEPITGLAWTADGMAIIFSSAGLWQVAASGGAPARLTEGEGRITTLSVARHGHRLVYAELVPEMEMWRTAGSSAYLQQYPPTKIIATPDDVGSPNVSRDGKQITWASYLSGTWEIWKSDIDGKNAVQLSFLGDVPTGSPRWSPNGKHVVFDGKAEDGLLNDIYVVDATGGEAQRLTSSPSVDIRPCYSKDQRWIYFTSNRTGTFQIWKIPAEGGEAIQVTKQGGYVAFESLDGEFLYYGKGRSEHSLWRVPIEGGAETKVLDNVDPSNFALCESGVYVLDAEAKPRPEIHFYSFATQRRTLLPGLPADTTVVPSGTSLGAAPGCQWLLFMKEGPVSSHLRAFNY